MGKPIAALLNSHTVKLNSTYLCLDNKCVLLWTLVRKKLVLQWVSIYSEACNCLKCKCIRNTGCLDVSGSCISTTTSKARGTLLMMTVQKNVMGRKAEDADFWKWGECVPTNFLNKRD